MNACLTLLLTVVFPVCGVFAQSEETDPVEESDDLEDAARSAFDAGERAFVRGDYEDALIAFTSAHALSAHPELLFNMATCHARLQHPDEALALYERYLTELPNAENRSFVEAQIERMRGASRSREDERTTDATESDAPSRGPAVVAFGVGGAGLVTFAIAGALAWSSHETLAACRPTATCEAGEGERGQTRALIADIGLVTAVTGTVVGVILWLAAGGDNEPEDDASALRWAPDVSSDGASVHLRGVF